MLPGVAQSRHLVLSAQFSPLLQPVVEQSFAGFHNLKSLQGDILETLGLVVGVYLLQMLVEQCGKLL